ncbi:MAG: hypothetical protein HWD59_01170 [Coxiellaceae bacterium]|nr:MAG: hypothetical protein HWD59_01170 [Coxiellaceae bacterium]
MTGKRTVLESWLTLPEDYCLFSPHYKKTKSTWTLPSYNAYPGDYAESSSEDENANVLFEKNGIIYSENTSTTSHSEVIAVDKDTHEEVGELITTESGEYVWLYHIEVNKDYRRRGIGTNLIKAILIIEPNLQIPLDGKEQNQDEDEDIYLTVEGHELINFCFKKNSK